MSFDYIKDDSIIACSTGNSFSAISLIRISTSLDFSAFNCFPQIKFPIKPRHSYFTDLVFGEEIFDEILVTFFEGPNSYTGENVIEISAHGNPLNVDRIISEFISRYHLRHSGPGEFTLRALENDKINVSQVEGLDILLNSKSSSLFDNGMSLLKGNLHEDFLELKKSFLSVKTAVEFNIDFSEDIGEEESKTIFIDSLASFKNKTEALLARTQLSSDLVSPKIVLFGETNAGKSTFFNQILGTNRSIVTPIEGTTRDYISEEIKLGSSIFTLIDTAGIRETSDLIEAEGIKASLKLVNESFFKVLLININHFPDLSKYKGIKFDFIVFSHLDENFGSIGASSEESFGSIGADSENSSGSIGAKVKRINKDVSQQLAISSLLKTNLLFDEKPISTLLLKELENFGSIGASLSELLSSSSGSIGANLLADNASVEVLNAVSQKYFDSFKKSPILVPRYSSILSSLNTILDELISVNTENYDIGIIDNYLIKISKYVNDLVGQFKVEEVLHSIFDNFCIGK